MNSDNSLIQFYKKYSVIINTTGLVTSFIFIIHGLMNVMIIDYIIFIYLGYKTIEAIEHTDTTTENIMNILKLWACYTTYSLIEKIMYFVVPFTFLYYISKLSFYMWIFKNSMNINIYYSSLITPFYSTYKDFLTELFGLFESYGQNALSIFLDYLTYFKNILTSSFMQLILKTVLDGSIVKTITDAATADKKTTEVKKEEVEEKDNVDDVVCDSIETSLMTKLEELESKLFDRENKVETYDKSLEETQIKKIEDRLKL